LYAMPVGIVVKKDLNIKTLDEFAGKRFNFGNRGSGNRAMAEKLFEYKKWTPNDFPTLTELSTKEMGEAFCSNKIDILLEILGHPAQFYEDMISKCNGAIFNFPPADIEGLIKILPYSATQQIPGKMYTDTPDDIQTFGYQAIMFSTSKVHPSTIFNVMNSTFGNLDKFRNVHPALKSITLKKMTDGLTIPLHDGAKRFYAKHGIKPE
ncbi:MAG: TAXI family TRAP transporter solute-binding subunit, partial [Rhodospirillales bacterium]